MGREREKEVCLASSGINGSIAQQIADSLNPAGRLNRQNQLMLLTEAFDESLESLMRVH